jgi:hypothetical protein
MFQKKKAASADTAFQLFSPDSALGCDHSARKL